MNGRIGARIKTSRIKNSALLLVFLGVLFSIPIIAKTWSTHGYVAALITGVLVIAAVVVGPLSFLIAGSAATGFVFSGPSPNDLEVVVALALGLALVLFWARMVKRASGSSIPYLPVTGWALIGAYFCVLQIFTHIT